MANLLDEASILLTATAYNNGSMLAVKPSVILGLELITNGNFLTNLDGWTLSSSTPPIWDNGMMKMTSDGATFSRADQSFVTKIGAEYKFKISKLVNNQTVLVKIGNSISGSNVLNQTLSSINEYTFTITAISTTTYIRLEDGSGTDGGYVSNISVKEDLNGDFTFSRNSAATRVNAQGLVENVQILSSNLVSNGDFSQEGSQLITNGDFSNGSTDWTLGTGWSIGENNAILNGDGSFQPIRSTSVISNGSNVKAKISVSNLSGILKIGFIGGASMQINQNGVFEANFTSNGGDFYVSRNSGVVTAEITNISVKEVGQNWTLGTGWSIGDGKAVYDGVAEPYLTNLNPVNIAVGDNLKFTFVLDSSAKLRFVGESGLRFSGTWVSYASGTHEVILTSGITATQIGIQADTDNGAFGITNISILEITNDTNLPRINYEGFSYDANGDIIPNSGCGSWLLEPQSTNLITQSELFSDASWLKYQATANVTTSQAPDGTTNSVYNFVAAGNSDLYTVSQAINKEYSISFYIKSNGQGSDTFKLRLGSAYSDLFTATSEWVRYSFSVASVDSALFSLATDGASASDLLVWGAQLEENSFSTSYIPTQGAISTRLQDIATNSGNASLINSESGVLYAEIKRAEGNAVSSAISLNDGTSSNGVSMYFFGVNRFYVDIFSSSGTVSIAGGVVSISDYIKVAVKYKNGDSTLWINGIEVGTNSAAVSLVGLNQLLFGYTNGSLNFYGNTKALAVYKTALTDAQLTALTTL